MCEESRNLLSAPSIVKPRFGFLAIFKIALATDLRWFLTAKDQECIGRLPDPQYAINEFFKVFWKHTSLPPIFLTNHSIFPRNLWIIYLHPQLAVKVSTIGCAGKVDLQRSTATVPVRHFLNYPRHGPSSFASSWKDRHESSQELH